MIEHCIAALKAEQEEKIYRAYVTDALMAAVENSARYIVPGVGEVMAGTRLTRRWAAETEPEPEEEPEDTRTAEEIAGGIWQRMRGETE